MKLECDDNGNYMCPTCGKIIFDADSGLDSCKHVEVVFADIIHDFETTSKGFNKYFKKNIPSGEIGDVEDIRDFLQKYADTLKNTGVYEFSDEGMACGPLSCTTIFVIRGK